ncbi:NAD(P)-binding domain-containing protein [Crossiella sp. CA-258035]|uniref:NAD(P)-dependent oxidoreductase n=1 Tax=Crossiella sp. CA-258035 TaxID=2981138 RepID=UPI0024BD3994|nr:NAD(P)-binding domain-containing protein [Crossiella sp. CA-258035]WHT21643.1 NAD(P)-binding domain-containing protein [Crossiella sp. CA-258035]
MTIVGLGPMGQAMAAAYLDRGYAVTVWNRTASKADALVAKGAVRAETVAAALKAGGPVILSLTEHTAMYAILEQATDALDGVVLINLSSDTPAKSRAAAEWATGHGAAYLTGGVQVPPYLIATEGAASFYSGPKELFEAHRETLEVITAADYRGEDQGLAPLYYQIMITIFWTNMTAHVQALAMAEANGISAMEYLPYARNAADIGPIFMEMTSKEVDAREYPGADATLLMNLASAEHALETARDSGVDTALPATVAAIFRRAVDAGYGQNGFTSVFEVLRKQDA